jgi:ribonuclease P protein component
MNLRDHHKIVIIKKNTEIKEILSTAKRIHTQYGIFFIGKKKTDKQINFAVLIKKNVGNAVWRNYCKRIVRAYTRKNIEILSKNRQVIFLYNYEGKINYALLEKEFDKRLATL